MLLAFQCLTCDRMASCQQPGMRVCQLQLSDCACIHGMLSVFSLIPNLTNGLATECLRRLWSWWLLRLGALPSCLLLPQASRFSLQRYCWQHALAETGLCSQHGLVSPA